MIVVDRKFLDTECNILKRQHTPLGRSFGIYLIHERNLCFVLNDLSCELDLNKVLEKEIELPKNYRLLKYDKNLFILVYPNGQPLCGLKYREQTLEEKYLKKYTWSKTSTLEYD